MSQENPYSTPQTEIGGTMPGRGGQPLATRLQRFLGQFLDGIIVGVINFVITFFVIGPIFFATNEIGTINVLFLIVSTIVAIGVFFAVQGYLLATNGQTIGKMIIGTQIVSENDGKILPLGELAIKRYIPFFVIYNIPIIGGIVALVNALLIFRQNHHCLHDDVANTRVIKL